MNNIPEKPSTYDMWSASARKAYDDMEKRALKAEGKLAEVEQSFNKKVDYLTPVDDTLSWNVVVMRTLNDILSEAASTLDPSKIFATVTEIIGLFLNSSSVYICGWDSSQKTVTVLADYVNADVREKGYDSTLGLVYHLDAKFEEQLTTADGYWLSHFDDDLSQAEQIVYEKYGVKTFFYAPMYADGKVFGFIEAWDTGEKRDYSDNQKEFVATVAKHIASSVWMAQLHNSLAESEQRYRRLMDTMQGGVAYVDIHGTIQYVNQHFARMLETSSEDLISQNLDDIWEKYAIETDTDNEYRIDHENGAILYIQLAHTPIMTDTEQKIGQVFVYTDVSQRKETEKMTIELALEQERTQLLGQFIQDTSHEFYTPLSIINMKSHLLKNYYNTEQSINALISIQKQTRIISDLVKALVLIAYLGSVKSLSLQTYNLKQMIELVLSKVDNQLREKEQHLDFKVTNPKVMLRCDTEYFMMALTHIINNALRYTAQNGTIQVEITEADERIMITIEDSGIGMTEEQQAQIFNRFYRVDTAHSTQGLGLGMSIVKRIIELHHGTITIESQLEHGTKVTLSLPKVSIT